MLEFLGLAFRVQRSGQVARACRSLLIRFMGNSWIAREDATWPVRCGIECDANVIKLPFTGDIGSYRDTIATGPVPVVAMGSDTRCWDGRSPEVICKFHLRHSIRAAADLTCSPVANGELRTTTRATKRFGQHVARCMQSVSHGNPTFQASRSTEYC
jgi:hypothetical protein